MTRLIRVLGFAALVAFAAGCGRMDNNARGTNTGPPVKMNAKGPHAMAGPGEGMPKSPKKR